MNYNCGGELPGELHEAEGILTEFLKLLYRQRCSRVSDRHYYHLTQYLSLLTIFKKAVTMKG